MSFNLKSVLTPTAVILILANLVPIVGVLLWDWSVMSVLLVFWAENLIIGAYNAIKMIISGWQLRSQEGLGQSWFQVVFFVIHYGMFTLIHGAVLRSIFLDDNSLSLWESISANLDDILSAGLIWACLALVVSHGTSLVSNFLLNGAMNRLKPKQLMMQPYGRVLVLHICVVGGAALIQLFGTPLAGLVLLVLLKIGLDVRAHNRQTRQAVAAQLT